MCLFILLFFPRCVLCTVHLAIHFGVDGIKVSAFPGQTDCNRNHVRDCHPSGESVGRLSWPEFWVFPIKSTQRLYIPVRFFLSLAFNTIFTLQIPQLDIMPNVEFRTLVKLLTIFTFPFPLQSVLIGIQSKAREAAVSRDNVISPCSVKKGKTQLSPAAGPQAG